MTLPIRSLGLLIIAVVASTTLLTGCGSDDELDPSDATRVVFPDSNALDRVRRLDDPIPAPELTMESLEGDRVRLRWPDPSPTGRRNRREEVTLVNFWATWCAPCIKEIPDLVALQDSLGGEGLQIIGIALDREGRAVVEPFVADHNINYPVVLDSTGAIADQFGRVLGLPTTFVINTDGIITHRVLGVFPAEDYMPELKDMLGVEEDDA